MTRIGINTCPMSQKDYFDLKSKEEVRGLVGRACSIENEQVVSVKDEAMLQDEIISTLQFNASVNESEELRQAAIFWIHKIAHAMGLTTGSNHEYYEEKKNGQHEFVTVPAINSRMVTFHTIRAAIQAADHLKHPHVVFELALSEGGYTAQPMDEYAALIKAAHISLGIKNRVIFIQADHYQLDPDKYKKDPEKEVGRVKDAIVKAIDSGVYNIDIDTSKFETVDPAKTDAENQLENARHTADLLMFIREYEREHKLPCLVSVGGEVGEVGGENTRYPQVNAFLAEVKKRLDEQGMADVAGLDKVSINVGSSHGGVLGPDGRPLDNVPLDFSAHHDLYMKGRDPMSPDSHVLSVQHGASTLPPHYFPLFPTMHVAEIHLATGFQNIVWDVLEKDDAPLYEKMAALVSEHFSDKVKKHETEAVGLMKERKSVTQFVKRDLLLSPAIPKIEEALEKEFVAIIHSLYNLLLPKGGHIEEGERAD